MREERGFSSSSFSSSSHEDVIITFTLFLLLLLLLVHGAPGLPWANKTVGALGLLPTRSRDVQKKRLVEASAKRFLPFLKWAMKCINNVFTHEQKEISQLSNQLRSIGWVKGTKLRAYEYDEPLLAHARPPPCTIWKGRIRRGGTGVKAFSSPLYCSNDTQGREGRWDGRSSYCARETEIKSPFGSHLCSLADLSSFHFIPCPCWVERIDVG